LKTPFSATSLAWLVLAALLLAPWARGEVGPAWPHEGSDLAPDPRVEFGRLENGVRFAVMPNANPSGKLSLRLCVVAGSLDEQADERGYAHFVEHMAFNGTQHFPTGKLVEFLQRQGMGFGADVNADTSYLSTIYKLELSHSSPDAIREALQVFRDFADRILFDPQAVERERGIILSEARVRDTLASRRAIDQGKALLAGSLVPDRYPIGLPDAVRQATPARLQAFYRAWYRPERMTLVVVGDVDVASANAEIKYAFGDLAAGSPPRPPVPIGEVEPTGAIEAYVHHDPAELGTTVMLDNVQNVEARPQTRADVSRDVLLGIAHSVISERAQRLVSRKDSPEGGIGISTTVVDRAYRISQFQCGTSVDRWTLALRDLATELRSARTLGFTDVEIARARVGTESYYRDAVASQNGRRSGELADALADSLISNKVFLSPEDRLALTLSVLSALTPETCRSVLEWAWGAGRKVVFVSSANGFKATQADVAAEYLKSETIALDAPVDVSVGTFAYTDFGKPGIILRTTHMAATDSWDVNFKNGLRLHFKHTSFEPDGVRIFLHFGTGRLLEPKDKPGLGMLVAGQLFGGLGRHSFDDLHLILTGKQADTTLGAGADGFHFFARTTSANTLIFTQLLTAFMVDPAMREDSRAQINAALASFYQQEWDGPQGVINELIRPQLAGGDVRAGVPHREALEGYPLSAFRIWFLEQAKYAPMDITIVGDLALDDATRVAAATAGALPPPSAAPDAGSSRHLAFPAKPLDFTWNISGTKSKSGYVGLFWPLKGNVSGPDEVRLGLLMDILSDRLRVSIRQTMAETYAPQASAEVNRTFLDYGLLSCLVESSPADLRRVEKACLEQAAKIVKGGVTSDELVRVQQVRLADLDRRQQNNEYWLLVLDAAARYPETAESLAHGSSIISGTTAADINGLARRFLVKDQVSVFRITPK
jgi:zinc protease